MLVQDLIKELEKLPQDASIGILNEEGLYYLDNFRIENTKQENITYIKTYNKSKYDYFFVCNSDIN